MKYPTNAEIDAHELLDDELRKLCKVLRNGARSLRRDFTMYIFADIVLRRAGRGHIEAEDIETGTAHRRAAILYVYEALRACDIAMIREWPEFDEMLKSLEYLNRDLP